MRTHTPVARIPDDVLDSIRQAVDLVELVSRNVPLRKAGKLFKGCCPFHSEKTPSFVVTPERGTWHCFGCGKGGNAFTFLMEGQIAGLTFPEAARQLAHECGIVVPDDEDPEAAQRASRIERLREVMERACRFFENCLRAEEGAAARAYLARRGLTDATASRFRLGFAPPGWQNLIEAAQKAGIAEDDLVELGLARRRDAEEGRPARSFDMFRDRVMFPICDAQGRVVAFGARTMGDEEPKYLNSPETPLFTKGRTVYALHLAKQDMMKSGEAAVMEGYTDVLMAHQCGWPVAVAGLGTALTREQAALVARYAKRVHLVYDGDAAGLKAAEKNAPTFLPEEVETRVVVLPAGEDPCDTLLRGGLPALSACVEKGREAFEHLLTVKASAQDMGTVPGRARALDEVLASLVPVTGEVRRALYLRRACDEYRIDEEVVRRRFAELARSARRTGPTSRTATAPGAPPRPSANEVGPVQVAEGPVAAAPRAAPSPPAPAGPPPVVEDLLLEAMLASPQLSAEATERLPAASLRHPRTRALFELLARECGSDLDAVLGTLPDPDLAGYAALLRARGAGRDLERQGRDCLSLLLIQAEYGGLSPGLQGVTRPEVDRRALEPDEAEVLRRVVEFHRRRASPTPRPS